MKAPCTPSQAEKLILALQPAGRIEECPLGEVAGRVLRADIKADHDFPPFDRVTMDGVAVRFAEVGETHGEFRIVGRAAAGQPGAFLPSGRGSAVQVMTGAVLPEGSDCILPREWYEERDGKAILRPGVEVKPGVFIHRRGSDHRAGETLLRAGRRLGPVEVAIAAACGQSKVRVAAPFRIAVVATGDELVPVDGVPREGQIRRTNPDALAAALRLSGHAPAELTVLRDDRAGMRDGLAGILARHEMVVLTGGVSQGDLDFVPEVLADLGARLVLHGVKQRPGRPMGVWQMPAGTVVFGLPGNPVSALVCLRRYVLPALVHWGGGTPRRVSRHVLSGEFPRPPGLTLFLPVLEAGDGSLKPSPVANSGDFAGLAGTCGFVEIDESFAERSDASYYSWSPS